MRASKNQSKVILWALVLVGMMAPVCGAAGIKHNTTAQVDDTRIWLGQEVPIELTSTGAARVSYPEAFIKGIRLYASGFVIRQAGNDPVPGAHIDVIAYDAQGHVVVSKKITYFPHQIPQDEHGLFRNSHFSARLKVSADKVAKVKYNFHNLPIADCKLETPH